MPLNIPGLLGALADLPGVINQGLLGPLPMNPGIEQMLGQQGGQARQMASNDFASSLASGAGLGASRDYARQGYSGRIFDALKEQELLRMGKLQQEEQARQGRFRQDPSMANLPAALQEEIAAKTIMAQQVPVSPDIQAKLQAGLTERAQQHEYDMALQAKRDAADLQLQQLKEANEGGITDLQHIKAVQALRKEFRSVQAVKDYETVLPLIKSAKKAPNTGYGDLQLIYTVGKALDPNSVVREGELQLTLAASDPASRVIGQAQFILQKGGRLTPKLRKDLVEMLEQRTSSYKDAYERDYKQFSQYARELGVEPSDVVGTPAESAYEQNEWVEVKPGVRVRRKQ